MLRGKFATTTCSSSSGTARTAAGAGMSSPCVSRRQNHANNNTAARRGQPKAQQGKKGLSTSSLKLRLCAPRASAQEVAVEEKPGEAFWAAKSKKTALVTGAAGGVGFALADSLAKRGFQVVICDIDEGRITAAEEALNSLYGAESAFATVCDVGSTESVDALASFAQDKLGAVDIWINNAGRNGGKIPLWEQTPENLAGVVGCNLMGILLCTRAAINVMKTQGGRAHIFNVTGSGVKGEATPGWSAYGATKRGMPQFTKSVLKEMDKYGGVENVSLHTMSPGMVFTDMLLSDATPNERKFFDILADEPDQVGEELIEKVLPIAATEETGANIQYLDTPRILQRILSPDLVKFLAGLAFPQLKIAPGKRIDADGNRIRLEGEEYRENGVKVMFKGMEERKSGL